MQNIACVDQPFCYLQGPEAQTDPDAGLFGGGTQQVYNDEPTPDDPTKPALSFPTGGGTLTQWTGSAWV
jgi:hypothetical protein